MLLHELEIDMKTEVLNLGHLGMDYLAHRNTLSKPNIHALRSFFRLLSIRKAVNHFAMIDRLILYIRIILHIYLCGIKPL